jgi:hypothetical protein
MATAAMKEAPKQRIHRRKGKPQLAYQTIGGKPLSPEQGQTLVLQASQRLRQLDDEKQRNRVAPVVREPTPLARSLQRLTDDVEAKIVEAVWTERCLPNGGSGGRCGISYLHDKTEVFANAVAAGDWQQKEYGAPLPRAIDEMRVTLSWLSVLDRDLAALVHAAAGSKRGNASSNVSWGEAKSRLSALREFPVRTLQRRYEDGLQQIMMKVTFG